MSLHGLRVGFFAFFALSTGVAINVLLLQPKLLDGEQRALAPRLPAQFETASLSGKPYGQKLKVSPAGTTPLSIGLNNRSARGLGHALRPDHNGVRGRFLPVNTGNTAELVRAVQRELKNKGYDPGAEDGSTGLVTRAAIFAFQYDHHLPLTAEPTERLLQTIVLGGSALKEDQDASAQTLSAEARDLVLATQRGLKKQGFWRSSVDGHFDTALSRAIQSFETAQNLPSTGRISGRFMARLARLSGTGHLAATRR